MERYNGTIWKAITMCLKSRNLPVKHWQDALPDVLHSIRSLICTTTNETPHERFLGFPRRSSSGSSVPSWLGTPGPIFIKRHVRTSKMDPLVDEVELLQANSHYAHVRHPDGRETTVATKHLAPQGQQKISQHLLQPGPEVNIGVSNDNTDQESPTSQRQNEQSPTSRTSTEQPPSSRTPTATLATIRACSSPC